GGRRVAGAGLGAGRLRAPRAAVGRRRRADLLPRPLSARARRAVARPAALRVPSVRARSGDAQHPRLRTRAGGAQHLEPAGSLGGVTVLEGSCLCGGVRFEVTGEFEPRSYCHCASCKRLSGGAATANGRARSDSIRITAGRELLRTYQPDEGSAKTFCSACGSNLFGAGWPESEFASVRLPAIDTP